MKVQVFLNRNRYPNLPESNLVFRWEGNEPEILKDNEPRYDIILKNLCHRLRHSPPRDYLDRAIEPGDVITVDYRSSFMLMPSGRFEELGACVVASDAQRIERAFHDHGGRL